MACLIRAVHPGSSRKSRRSGIRWRKIRFGEALEKNNWNVTRTARALGISRATLQNKMKKYGLRRSRST
ncbi:MAG: helix-turn-helix domain-containing protein [Alphaproteobacteria bacterium]